jgi:hypothetical protein
MSPSRTIPLFDPNAHPQSWNERMAPGEYAVLYSLNQPSALNQRTPGSPTHQGPVCTIFPTLPKAEQHAAQQVALQPTLRCRIYDHQGLGIQPVREFRGVEHKGESEISPRFRRWGGSAFFFGGIALFLVDWISGFDLSWPSIVAARMLPVGIALLVMEFGIVLEARRKNHRAQSTP